MISEDGMLSNDQAKQIIMDLYRKGHGRAFYTIERILGNQLTKDEIEDLVQEGFVRLLIHVDRLRRIDTELQMRYLTSTMRNVAIDEGRRLNQKRMTEDPDDENFPEQDPQD